MQKRSLLLLVLALMLTAEVFSAPAIYLNKARTLKRNTLMLRPYYTYSGMENLTPSGSNHVNSHMGILFMSYGLTDNITLGTNLSNREQ